MHGQQNIKITKVVDDFCSSVSVPKNFSLTDCHYTLDNVIVSFSRYTT